MKKLILTAALVAFGASSALATDEGFILVNDTTGPICFAFASATNEKMYGDDILVMADCLPIKAEAVIVLDTTVNPAWDILIKDDADGESVYTNINLQGIDVLTVQPGGKMIAKQAAPKAEDKAEPMAEPKAEEAKPAAK